MKTRSSSRNSGFTLLETVIAIGVLAVLLTGFMYVFGPAAAGIKRAIGIQEADRLASTLEQELVTLRGTSEQTSLKTGFNKAFDRIKNSTTVGTALLVYQYRGSLSNPRTDDGTPTPLVDVKGKLPGQDYVLQTMVRSRGDTKFKEDLAAVEGGVYYVKCTQLIFKSGELGLGTANQISDPKTGIAVSSADLYPEAVIAFTGDFYALTNKKPASFDAALTKAFGKTSLKPIFSRNLAVRR
jgi:prepilin-type N-terminal cleavage/methylation domain-containing protein